MLLKIAWRNIWRNPLRSLLLILAVGIGIWSLIFLLGFMNGMTQSYVDHAVRSRTSHIQIHDSTFLQESLVKNYVVSQPGREDFMSGQSEVLAHSKRYLINGMVSTGRSNAPIRLIGVNPRTEDQLTGLASRMVEGEYLDTEGKSSIILGRELAEKLGVSLRSKVVVQCQDVNGEIVSAAFRVKGIFSSGNGQLDAFTAYSRFTELQNILGLPEGSYHQMAFVIAEVDSSKSLAAKWSQKFTDIKIQSYLEIAPDLALYQEQLGMSQVIMTTIFMLALIFGIINTMLMAVLERIRELGMLMAIGMGRVKVFFMIVFETIFLAFLGAPLGLLLGYGTIHILHRTGIDLSRWSDALESFGMGKIVRPELSWDIIQTIIVGVVITAILASIYPALKAIRLRPVEALRKI